MTTLKGTAASPGISFGNATIYLPQDVVVTDAKGLGFEPEMARLTDAVSRARAELADLTERLKSDGKIEMAHIFRSQQTILEDESLNGEITTELRTNGGSAETAVQRIFGQYAAMFEAMDEKDYNRARLADLEDVRRRLQRKLLHVEDSDLSSLAPGTIVVAPDLLPSDTARLDRANVCGMITERGGVTSHTAILAKTLGIPAAVSVSDAVQSIRNQDEIILDAGEADGALVYVNPDPATRERLSGRLRSRQERLVRLAAEKDSEPVTTDGRRIILSANIGSPEDLDDAEAHGVSSVGLFRTEFLFMRSTRLPTEQEQYEAYRTVCRRLAGGMVIIRTLDVGGDKSVPSLALPREANPFLGYRALRVSLDNRELFMTQLRAALRASAVGDVRLMFPMVCGMEDWRRAREMLAQARAELASEGREVGPKLQVGIMVEIPSAVFMADELAAEADFMSIGTNDLTQYMLAADRMNEHASRWYRPFHPAVLRAIRQVVEAAHRHNKWVGVCGELAGIPLAVPALVGIGVDELSMSARSLPEVKHVVVHTSYAAARGLAQRLLALEDSDAVEDELRRYVATESHHQ